MLLAVVGVTFDAIFAMLAFWTVNYPIPFGKAIFGYTVYNMFYILPTPPGQIGSNELVGALVFNKLLSVPVGNVGTMFVFSHPWAALLVTGAGMVCLGELDVKISTAMEAQTEGH